MQAYQLSSAFVSCGSVDSLHVEVSRSGYIPYSRVTASLVVRCNSHQVSKKYQIPDSGESVLSGRETFR